jgi:hypothetical protein
VETVVDKLILLPRFTTFAGATTFETPPMNVRGYGQALLDLMVAGRLGAPPAGLAVTVQESPDLGIWQGVGTLVPGATTEVSFSFEWMRLTITVSGPDPAVTCWCVGNFVRRQAA